MRKASLFILFSFCLLMSCDSGQGNHVTTSPLSKEKMDYMTWYAQKRGLLSYLKRPKDSIEKFIDSLAIAVYFHDKPNGVPAWYNTAFKTEARQIMDSIEAVAAKEKALAPGNPKN